MAPTETEALPVVVQLLFVLELPVTGGLGWVMFTIEVILQPAASVTETVYVPAVRPPALLVEPPAGDQLYV